MGARSASEGARGYPSLALRDLNQLTLHVGSEFSLHRISYDFKIGAGQLQHPSKGYRRDAFGANENAAGRARTNLHRGRFL